MTARRLVAWSCLAALAFAACAKKSEDVARSAPHAGSAATPAKTAEGGLEATRIAPGQSDNRKVIRTGRVELVVASYDEARKKLDALLERAGGYIDATEVHRRADAIGDATIVIRIPRDAFGAVIPSLRELGEVVSETTNANDITDSYVDLSARLTSDRELERRLLELATARAGKIDQILEVEKELARVRGEIEGYDGRLRQWDSQVAMSTLTLSLVTKRPEIATAPTSFGDQSSATFHDSIAALHELGAFVVFALIAVLPWLVVLVPAALLARRLIRNRRAAVPTAIAHAANPPQ